MMGRHKSKIRTWEEVIIIRIWLVSELMSRAELTSSRVAEGMTEEYNEEDQGMWSKKQEKDGLWSLHMMMGRDVVVIACEYF